MTNHNLRFRYLPLLVLLLLLGGCQAKILQTVESGELIIDDNDPSYKFSRNQENSVDIREPQYLRESIEDLGVRFLDQAYLGTDESIRRAMELYHKGLYGYAPYEYISTSYRHAEHRELLLKEIQDVFDSLAEISGYGADDPIGHRRREAVEGQSGLISNKLGSELIFIDPKGLELSEVFRYMTYGTIAMDQIINVHLYKCTNENEELIAEHETHKLVQGQNYTDLEHHWDLAYGYYKYFWRDLAKGDGIPALRGCHRELDLAFTLGRIDINFHLYSELPKYANEIRHLLSKVLMIRIKEYLQGGNTLSNLTEDPVFAFPLLSRGYALLYSAQFVNDTEGHPCFTYQEVKDMQQMLIGDRGFWGREPLVSETDRAFREVIKMLSERLSF